ncbi:SUMF1/EgtB/PvdO family nonheme iron enzyme [Hoeflea sp.]|uniref:SUMF1/EgtB/PvdO family nonheme iron enzyme n=1 Tax=Hoeflea sp. TaxID=1940281 RepID=UPI003B01FDE7
MARIFVSHASADDEAVTRLSQWLSDNGFEDHFVDHIHIPGGTEWNKKLPEEIVKAEILLPVVTPGWLNSDECYNEYRSAYYANKTVVPLFVLSDVNSLSEDEANRLDTLSHSVQGVQSPTLPLEGAAETLLRGSLELSAKRIASQKRARLVRQVSVVAGIVLLAVGAGALYFRDYLAAYWDTVEIARSFDAVAADELNGRFIECDSTDFCPRMVELPQGQYLMGASDEFLAEPEEWPRTEITIDRRIAVSETEITRSQWAKCSVSTRLENTCKDIPIPPGQENHPVDSVSWLDAQAYIAWLNEQVVGVKEGPYRLLSEAEWEYAARGLQSVQDRHTLYFWGDRLNASSAGAPDVCSHANGLNKEMPDNFIIVREGLDCPNNPVMAARVGSLSPNPFGLYDTAGNLAEWVEDCWHDSYHQRPQNQDPWLSSEDTSCERVIRGGSWFGEIDHLRSAARVSLREDQFGFNIGFRIARDLNWSP